MDIKDQVIREISIATGEHPFYIQPNTRFNRDLLIEFKDVSPIIAEHFGMFISKYHARKVARVSDVIDLVTQHFEIKKRVFNERKICRKY